jgi:hypothetical protein
MEAETSDAFGLECPRKRIAACRRSDRSVKCRVEAGNLSNLRFEAADHMHRLDTSGLMEWRQWNQRLQPGKGRIIDLDRITEFHAAVDYAVTYSCERGLGEIRDPLK